MKHTLEESIKWKLERRQYGSSKIRSIPAPLYQQYAPSKTPARRDLIRTMGGKSNYNKHYGKITTKAKMELLGGEVTRPTQ